MALPDCDELFLRYFEPWLSVEDRKRRGYRATKPDVEELNVPAELTASDLSPLTDEGQIEMAARIREMVEAASGDWITLLSVEGVPSPAWISEFDNQFQRRQIQQIIDRSDPRQYDNEYLVLCCELGAVLGIVFASLEPRLVWLYEWPYWDSALYDQATRSRINIFHWALKKMSEYGVEDGLLPKLEACRRILHEPR